MVELTARSYNTHATVEKSQKCIHKVHCSYDPKTRNYTKSYPQKDRYSEEDKQMPQGKENMHTCYMHKEHTVCMHVCIDRHRYMDTTDGSSG